MDPAPLSIYEIIYHENQDPDHIAIESPNLLPLTYRELREQMLYVVKTLNSAGFHRNDRIGVIAPAGPDTAVLLVSVMAGFTCIPLNPELKSPEFEKIFLQLKMRAIIVASDCDTAARGVAAARNIPVIELVPSLGKAGGSRLKVAALGDAKEPEFAVPSDIAVISLTSGTTSEYKIVPISQQQHCQPRQRRVKRLHLTKNERCLHIVPMYHGLGFSTSLLDVLVAGGTIVCTKDFIPNDFLSLLKEFRPTFYSASPALHQAILRELSKVSPDELQNHTLRMIISSSAVLPRTILHKLEERLGVPVVEVYASSETGVISTNYPPRPGSVGIPVVEQLQILDDNDMIAGNCQLGEIVVKGDSVFSGYENAPDENNAAFIDGWFRTGDIGYLDDDGYLFIKGRKKELINKGGRKISPAEIDNILASHPGVRDVMTFRIPDPVLGEDIAAMVVVGNTKVSEEELRRYVIDRLIQFKVPKRIYFVDEIPKGPNGKLLRYIGTERYNAGDFHDAIVSGPISKTGSSELSVDERKILHIWKDILEIESLGIDDDFFRCGGNSLSGIQLLIKIEREFHVNLPPDSIYVYPTIRQQVRMVVGKSGNKKYHPLVIPIREKGSLPPLFCIHPIDGWIEQYRVISPLLDQNRPLFGIRARGLKQGENPHQTVDEAVLEYSLAIKSVQKEGPYYLMGYSGGGPFAFALSCHFQKTGDIVAYLGIIDIDAPLPPRYRLGNLVKEDNLNASMAAMFQFFNKRLQKHSSFHSQFLGTVSFISQVLLLFFESKKNRISQKEGTNPSDSPMPLWVSVLPKQNQMLIMTQKRILNNYQPDVFSGNIYLYSTRPDAYGNPARGWNEFIRGNTIIFDIPGDHNTCINDSNCNHVVAQKIEESLRLAGQP